MRPIRLDTARNLYANRHRLAVYCPACTQWAELSGIALARLGVLDREIATLRFRCRRCRTRGETQVRPPVPSAGAAHAMG